MCGNLTNSLKKLIFQITHQFFTLCVSEYYAKRETCYLKEMNIKLLAECTCIFLSDENDS